MPGSFGSDGTFWSADSTIMWQPDGFVVHGMTLPDSTFHACGVAGGQKLAGSFNPGHPPTRITPPGLPGPDARTAGFRSGPGSTKE